MSREDDLFCGVNSVVGKKVEDMSELEKKHAPVITAPDRVKAGEPFEVKVETGVYVKHPNEYGHYFSWIEIWLDETFVARFDLQPVVSTPSVSLKITAPHSHEGKRKIKALAFCNLHGVWENVKEVEVE